MNQVSSNRHATLVYWLNSLDFPSCLIVDDLLDLADGRAIADIVGHVISPLNLCHTTIDHGGTLASAELFRASLEAIHNSSHISSLPYQFHDSDVICSLVAGDESLLSKLLSFLRSIYSHSRTSFVSKTSTPKSSPLTHSLPVSSKNRSFRLPSKLSSLNPSRTTPIPRSSLSRTPKSSTPRSTSKSHTDLQTSDLGSILRPLPEMKAQSVTSFKIMPGDFRKSKRNESPRNSDVIVTEAPELKPKESSKVLKIKKVDKSIDKKSKKKISEAFEDVESVENFEISEPSTTPLSKAQIKLMTWFLSIVSDTTNHDANISTFEEFMQLFSDGVLLCKVVSKLERIPEMNGVENHPRSNAAKLSNIERSFKILRQNKKIDPLLVFSARNLLSSPNQIFSFLKNLKQCYSYRFAKSQQRPATPQSIRPVVKESPSAACFESSGREFLENLKILPSNPKVTDTVLENPFKNGTVLAKLASIFSPVKGSPIKKPRTLPQARKLIEHSLNVLLRLGLLSREFSSKNDSYIDRIISGDSACFWELIERIRIQSKSFSTGDGPRRKTSKSVRKEITQQPEVDFSESLRNSELVLRVEHWFKEIQLIARDKDLVEVNLDSLLVKLAEIVHQSKISGLIVRPASDSQHRHNRRRIFKIFVNSAQSSTSRTELNRYLDQFVAGQFLNFLDKYRHFVSLKAPSTATLPRSHSKSSFTPRSSRFNPHSPNQSLHQSNVESTSQTFDFDSDSDSSPSTVSSVFKQKFSNNLVAPKITSDIPIIDSNFHKNTPIFQNSQTISAPISFSSSLLPYKLTSPSIPHFTTTESSSEPSTLAKSLFNWLTSLGLVISSPIIFDEDPIMEIDGLFLCKLIVLLEKKELQGVCFSPSKPAENLANLRLFLKFLSTLPCFKNISHFDEHSLLRGDREEIVGLLTGLKSSYRHVSAEDSAITPPFSKTNSSSSQKLNASDRLRSLMSWG
ncbi:hypothetical protein GEMRC1_010917 [Eukaryota sp. GEM-RC1]